MKMRVKRHAVVQPLDKSYRLIPLTQGQNAIVDMEDFKWLSERNWCAHWNPITKSFYAVRSVPGKRHSLIQMHNEILNQPKGKQCDHVNHDTLDNRRFNLRESTKNGQQQNRRKPKNNTTGYKGVYWDRNRWRVRIHPNGKSVHIGDYPTPKDAAHAYDEAAKHYFGEFAKTNF